LAREGYESDSVTAFFPPEGVAASDLLALLSREFGVEAQGGQAHLQDSLIRIGHMGWAHEPELREAVAAITEATGRLATGRTQTANLAN
jgi:aspartate aminotransferase-like enzyme